MKKPQVSKKQESINDRTLQCRFKGYKMWKKMLENISDFNA